MSEQEAIVESTGRRLSAIWIVPVVALLLGIWLAVDAYLDQGPTIVVHFSDAEGIEADKTLVKIKNVTIGMVTGVRLAKDLSGVVVTAELDPETQRLLREDSEIWVTRAEVRGVSVSGLGTLLSGAFLEISPGIGAVTRRRNFNGLERRPISPHGTPGKRLGLISESSGSVGVGSPILYRGYQVGTVESTELDVTSRRVLYSIFIDAPFHQLVSSNTRFWNASGVSVELSTEGFKLSIGSLQSALVGGVSFDLPHDSGPGKAVESETTFRLYPNESSIHDDPYRYATEYVVEFDESLRGLHPGAPVTYRGIRIGSVERIMLADLNAVTDVSDAGRPIPVLIKLEPGRLRLEDSEEGLEETTQSVQVAVERGLRATLASGNLLTGARFIELDYFEADEQQFLGDFIGYPTIPSVSGGLAHIQVQVTRLLDKLNQLPIGGAVSAATNTLAELEQTLAAARHVLQSDGVQQLPADVQATLEQLDDVLAGFSSNSKFHSDLTRTLEELKDTLQSVEVLTDQLGEKPNSLVFPIKQSPDPEPRANP